MSIKIKERDAGYCNLKVFLIFLVVYGHLIEPELSQSQVLTEIYKIIYMVHMPLFVFLSGLFVRNEAQSKMQCKKAILTYLAIMLLIGQNPLKPYWHLWYLLSLAWWSLFGVLWKKVNSRWLKWMFIGLAIVAGCCAGFINEVNRWLSLSRTIVFLPYYLLGMREPQSKNPGKAIVALFIGTILYIEVRKYITPEFLYHAESFNSKTQGPYLRAVCYAIGCCWGYGLWQLRLEHRFWWTPIGADTLWIYILHAPFVLVLQSMQIHTPLAAAVVIIVCRQASKWGQQLCIIKKGGPIDGHIQGCI